MGSGFDEIVQKRFSQIKRLAFLVLGALIIMLGVSVAADLPVIDASPGIWIALLVAVIIITICGICCSRLHKVQWIKRILVGQDAAAINEKKLKRASGCYLLFSLCSFAAWFNLGAWGLVGSVFLGGKFWLAILGFPAIAMMMITWPKKDDLINFIKVD